MLATEVQTIAGIDLPEIMERRQIRKMRSNRSVPPCATRSRGIPRLAPDRMRVPAADDKKGGAAAPPEEVFSRRLVRAEGWRGAVAWIGTHRAQEQRYEHAGEVYVKARQSLSETRHTSNAGSGTKKSRNALSRQRNLTHERHQELPPRTGGSFDG